MSMEPLGWTLPFLALAVLAFVAWGLLRSRRPAPGTRWWPPEAELPTQTRVVPAPPCPRCGSDRTCRQGAPERHPLHLVLPVAILSALLARRPRQAHCYACGLEWRAMP